MVREGLRQGRDSVGAVAHFHKSWNRPTLKCPLAPGSLVSTPLVEQQEHMGLWWVGGWTKCTMCSKQLPLCVLDQIIHKILFLKSL